MNLTSNRIEAIVRRYDDLASSIQNRWQDFIGFGCGYFKDFSLEGDYIRVNFTLRQNTGYDLIHKSFFIMPESEAKAAFKVATRESLDSFGHAWVPQKYTPKLYDISYYETND